MNIIIEKYRQLEKELGEYLDQLNQKPPFGFGQFLKPLNQSFQMCRVLGQQMQAQHKRITELENALAAYHSADARAAIRADSREDIGEAANDE